MQSATLINAPSSAPLRVRHAAAPALRRGRASAPCRAAGPQQDAQQDLDPRQWIGGGFDPDGLLGDKKVETNHFARRGVPATVGSFPGVGKPAAAPATPAMTKPIERVDVEGGVSPAEEGFDDAALRANLAANYMPVDIDRPGVKVLNMEPPVLTVDDFLTHAECDTMIAAAADSGAMAQSAIGDATVGSACNALSSRRTSTTVLLDDTVCARTPALRESMQVLQSKIRDLLPGGQWGATGKLPAPGTFCFEMPQVARYEPGQHFLAHEDAFPEANAIQNQFQRRATVLVYLNDVAEGGRTRFEELNVAAQPAKGRALIFFPSTADGAADARTLHTATDAVDEKWVTQQWVAWGMPAAQTQAGLDPQLAKLLATAKAQEQGGAAAAAGLPSTGRIEARLAARREKFEAENTVAAEALTRKKNSKKSKKGKGKGKGAGARKGFGS